MTTTFLKRYQKRNILSTKTKASFQDIDFYIFADNVRNQFNVVKPYTMLCCDIHTIKNATVGGINTKLKLFACMDMCTGKIVAFKIEKKIDSKQICHVLIPLLNKVHAIYQGKETLTLHSDRGTEFRSNNYHSLQQYRPWLTLSMNNYKKPTDNAVIERWFRTAKQLDKLWIKATGSTRIDDYSSIEDATEKWNKWISIFNDEHKNKRNELLGANAFEQAIFLKYQIDTKAPTSTAAATKHKSIINQVALEQIQAFKQEAAQEFTDLQKLKSNDPILEKCAQMLKIQQMQLDAIVHNQLEMGNTMPKLFKQQVDDILDGMRENFFNNTKKKTNKPRPLRTAFTFQMQLMFEESFQQDTISIYKRRDGLAILTQAALGCRINEIRLLTFGDMHELLQNCALNIEMSKVRRIETKVISKEHAKIIQNATTKYKQALKRNELPCNDQHYVFTSLTTDNFPLTSQFFIVTVNKQLKLFEKWYNNKHNTKEYLLSHSARINLATELFANLVNLDQIRSHLGHTDLRSTLTYSRHTYTAKDKQNTLNNLKRSA